MQNCAPVRPSPEIFIVRMTISLQAEPAAGSPAAVGRPNAAGGTGPVPADVVGDQEIRSVAEVEYVGDRLDHMAAA